MLKDWKAFQQHETKRRKDESKQLLESIKKGAIQVPTAVRIMNYNGNKIARLSS